MRIEMSHRNRLATVWLARGEREDPAVQTQLAQLYADCKGKKYTVAVYHSGARDLMEQTSSLLCYNRRRTAQPAGGEYFRKMTPIQHRIGAICGDGSV